MVFYYTRICAFAAVVYRLPDKQRRGCYSGDRTNITGVLQSCTCAVLRVRVAAHVRGVFVCVNCGVTPYTFPCILHVSTSPHTAPRILHVPAKTEETPASSKFKMASVSLFMPKHTAYASSSASSMPLLFPAD